MWKGDIPGECNYLGKGLETRKEDQLMWKACVGERGEVRYARWGRANLKASWKLGKLFRYEAIRCLGALKAFCTRTNNIESTLDYSGNYSKSGPERKDKNVC